MSKIVDNAVIVSKEQLNSKYFILELKTTKPVVNIEAGQFVQLQAPVSANVFLRRPFSVHDVTGEGNIRLLIHTVGKATKALSYVKKGDELNIIYPLGKGFSYKHLKNNALLVGGGCGIAPLLLLAKQLNNLGIKPDIIIGTKTSDELIEIELYKKYANVFITTEDGTEGVKGYVTQHPVFADLKKYNQIYTCGPEVMMKAVAKIAKENNVPCEVSLENTMACGIGACLCCITPTIEGNICVCTEGPVFNTNYLLW